MTSLSRFAIVAFSFASLISSQLHADELFIPATATPLLVVLTLNPNSLWKTLSYPDTPDPFPPVTLNPNHPEINPGGIMLRGSPPDWVVERVELPWQFPPDQVQTAFKFLREYGDPNLPSAAESSSLAGLSSAVTVTSVPEPSTLTLLGSALLGLAIVYLRRRGAKA